MAFILIHNNRQKQNYLCLSTDVKPTANIPISSICYETNTKNSFIFDGTSWQTYDSASNGLTLAAGIAAWLAAPSSANLAAAMTDKTGTGALVFGTIPTFTTSIRFGGTSSSFPSIKQSSAVAQARLADDSAFAQIQGKLTTDVAAVTGLTAGVVAALTTATIVLYDSTGTAYRVPCITP